MFFSRPRTFQPKLSLRIAISFLSLLGILSVLLAGCATVEEQMAGYVGQHKSELINNWGPPAEEKKLKNGGSRLVYREQNPLIHPGQYVDPASNICEKVFTTDSRGIIKSYKHENCE
ncbi:MAG: hypothetical protein JSU59_07045 [Nitrospirota bacterium]|nr:MAG: hypothetical protein JSU59_07045 [Nitrospirota bacterium]